MADDHPVVRRGLRQMIEMESDMHVAVEASSAKELLEKLEKQPCDAAILDIELPDRNGLDLLQSLRERNPGLPAIVLSVYPPSQFAARAIRSGASAYLTKETATEELIKAIRMVVQGRRYLTAETAEAIAAAIQTDEVETPEASLSARERQVLELYASGRTITEIAELTQLSVRTVSTYKSRVLEKLRLSSNAELIAFALRQKAKTGDEIP